MKLPHQVRCLLARAALLGRLSRGYNAARFAGTLAMLAGSGVPILKALRAAAETCPDRAMRADAMDALVQVREARHWLRHWLRRRLSWFAVDVCPPG